MTTLTATSEFFQVLLNPDFPVQLNVNLLHLNKYILQLIIISHTLVHLLRHFNAIFRIIITKVNY